QSGVSGFILPGHRVDVIRFEQDQGGQRGDCILENILVLAAGQVFTRAEERSLTTRTVTLALMPEQVDTLVAARAKGSLSLALRGVNDHDVVARPKPKPKPQVAAVDPAEARWKAEEEKRQKLERQIEELKASLAAKAAAPPPAPTPPPPPAPPPARYATIHPRAHKVHRMPP